MSKSNITTKQISTMKGTKWKLFKVALDQFSTKGYANVGIRDIASAVNIKSASIYNHFENKEAFLTEIFNFFWSNYRLRNTDVDTFLSKINTASPEDIIEELLIPFGGESEFDTMRKVLSIAIAEYHNNKQATDIVSEVFFITSNKLKYTIDKMIELDLIEHVDMEAFTQVYTATSLSATLLLGGKHAITFDQWKAGRKLLLTLIRKKSTCEDCPKTTKKA